MTDVPLFRRRSHAVLVVEDDPASQLPDLDPILPDSDLPGIDGLEILGATVVEPN
jgi:hypothetical protein